MANLEVLALDTAVPQIRAPGAGDGYSVPRDMTLSAGTTLTAPTVAVSTGNLTFSGTAQRITGDMSNATESNRLAFQTSTTNGGTRVNILTNGTGTASSLDVFGVSDPTNAAVMRIRQSGSESQVLASITGTGTYLPMTFYTGGSERMRIDTSGKLLVGLSSSGSTASKLQVTGGTNNATSLATAYSDATVAIVPKSTSGYSIAVASGTSDFPLIQVSANGAAAGDLLLQPYGGNVGIGGTADADTKVNVLGTLPTSATNSNGFYVNATIPSGTTNNAISFSSRLATAAGSFTTTWVRHFDAVTLDIGAGSAVTNQAGFFVRSTLTGATNNYGFYSNIASGSNRWNFYAAGTAQNYFAGATGINTLSADANLTVASSGDFAAAAIFYSNGSAANWARTDWKNANIASTGIIYMDSVGEFAIRNDGNYPLSFYTNGGNQRMTITGAGNVVAGGSVALATTATDGFLYVPTCAGTPTGTPTTITGMAPIVVDTTNNKLYFYSTGVWRDAGP